MSTLHERQTTNNVRRISSVLIANRGEIALRIIRACREMHIRTVAVYTPADRGALHAALADDAYPIDNYLHGRLLIAVALRSNADAIHPGYGFLAENAAFAAAVARAGLVFVGPPAAVITRMGSKVAARQLAERAGVPLVPGTTTPLRDVAEAKRVAAKIGYPVLLKAVAGGGGKGMRIVAQAAEMASGFRLAAAEAQAAFGNGQLYLEKYLVRPRHIEVQLLADRQGHIVHCFERECSVQRRHQKIVEETPSPFLDAATRAAICDAAVRFARAGRYLNAGTVEFLVDAKRHFYFLEMNTRIQVEHPITELLTGIDLVTTQLQIAMGRPLPWTQEKIIARGHAIECRIYAENPFANFFPSPGTITTLVEPHGPGVRMDTGVTTGSRVPIDYDPILGKCSVWGTTRREAIARMQRALQEYRIGGIVTNIALHQRILAHTAFRAGTYDITFVERHAKTLTTIAASDHARARIMAAVAAELKPHSPPSLSLPPASSDGPSAQSFSSVRCFRRPLDAVSTSHGGGKAEGTAWTMAARQEGVARGLGD